MKVTKGTRFCIVCGKFAEYYAGYVIRHKKGILGDKEEKVAAGFCSSECSRQNPGNGFKGDWNESMEIWNVEY